jgi:hypothetical protein
MKTNYYFSTKSISIYLIIGLISSVITSCGNFKNSSYTDRDGIYGSDEHSDRAANNNTKYKEYFSSFRDNSTPEEIFTNIDTYSTTVDTLNSYNTESYSSGYAGWGNNQQPTNVTINNNNWGWDNFGYGAFWNLGWNSWYGPNIGFGWGWNNWFGPNIGFGWGWNNWYGPNYGYYGWGFNNYYNGYYGNYYGGNNNHYSYSNGIRGRSSGRYFNGRVSENYVSNNFTVGRRNSSSNGVRNSTDFIPRRETTNPRNYIPTRAEVSSPRNSTVAPRNYNPVREETPPTRSENYTPRSSSPTRSDSSPRSESNTSPRSYSPSSNSGGGSGGGSYGGGRSGGSGGRR